MSITPDQIKIRKAVNNTDTDYGGGAMSGDVLIDGSSNDLFPDSSTLNRTNGRIEMRELFPVVESPNTESLLGAVVMLTKPPTDTNVIATIFRTGAWGDYRKEAQKIIERYLVKGPRASIRLMDEHYTGSQVVSFYTIGSGRFPSAGDCVVLVNPARVGVGDEFEQYVRIRNRVIETFQQQITEGGQSITVTVTKCTCDIDQPLRIDVLGPPVCRVFSDSGVLSEESYGKVFTTSVADSARFFGCNPLASAAAAGDMTINVSGGIFTQLVPSVNREEAIVNQSPSDGTSILVSCGYQDHDLVGIQQRTRSMVLPTSIAPNTLRMNVYANNTTSNLLDCVDDGKGKVYKDSVLVATVDYRAGTVFFESIEYVTVYNGDTNFYVNVKFKQAVVIPCDTITTSLPITIGNQGSTYVAQLSPAPAPGTLEVSFAALGNWYELTADNSGRIGGGSYGSGSVNSIGSLSITTITPPDIGSEIVISYGSNTNTLKPDAALLPTKLFTELDTGVDVYPAGRTLTWTDRNGTARSASVSTSGVLSGDATGAFVSQRFIRFIPSHFPNADGVTLGYKEYTSSPKTTVIPADGTNPQRLDVSSGAIEAGTVFLGVSYTDFSVILTDRSGGELWGTVAGTDIRFGTINYVTGIPTLYPTVTIQAVGYGYSTNTLGGGWADVGASSLTASTDRVVHLVNIQSAHYYNAGAFGAAQTVVMHPSEWVLSIPVPASNSTVSGYVPASSLAFKLGSVTFVGTDDGSLKSLNYENYVGEVVGMVGNDGSVRIQRALVPSPDDYGKANNVTVLAALVAFPSLGTERGVFRTSTFPLKAGVAQIYGGGLQSVALNTGVLQGDFQGTIDFRFGVVKWTTSTRINAADIRYNCVALTNLPIDPSILGLDTARLPSDGKVPLFRPANVLYVHHSQVMSLDNPPKGVDIQLRPGIKRVRVKSANGLTLPPALYAVNLTTGVFSFIDGTDTTAYTTPWTIEDTIEDSVLAAAVDISGTITLARGLTNSYPAGAFVSNAMQFGDLQAMSYNDFAQQAWTGVWAEERIGGEVLANYNAETFPVFVTNDGAIKQRWAFIFTSTTAFRCIGDTVGQVGTGSTTADFAPINPITGKPYFTIRSAGWGSGWGAGMVLRNNTGMAGDNFWVARTTLQGPAQADSDEFKLAFRFDVNRVTS